MALTSDEIEGKSRRLFGMALIITSSIAISFGGLISRSLDGDDASQANLYRSGATALVVGLILLHRYRGGVVRNIIAVGRPGLIGGITLSFVAVTFMQAITTTTVANTLFTLGAIPFITAALAWVMIRERLTMATLVTMLIAGAGVFVMIAEGIGGGSLYGNVMALITAVGFSIYTVIVRKNRHVDMLPANLIGACGVVLGVLVFQFEVWQATWWDIFLCFIWGGLLSGFGHAFFVVASRHLYAAEITVFMMLEFALGPIWVWLAVNEIPSRWTLAGGSLIAIAVIARASLQMREERKLGARTHAGH